MAHRSSSAALHAAWTIRQHYSMSAIPRERIAANVSFIPNLKADEAWTSVIIDWTTNAFRVANLRPEWTYWTKLLHQGDPDPGQILMFVQHMVSEMETVPKDPPVEQRPTFVSSALPPAHNRIHFASEAVREKLAQGTRQTISNASLQATTYLFAFYWFVPKAKTFFNDEAMKADVAQKIEVSLGLSAAMAALPLAKRCEQELRAGRLTLGQIKRYFREIGVFLEELPNYSKHEEETKLLVG